MISALGWELQILSIQLLYPKAVLKIVPEKSVIKNSSLEVISVGLEIGAYLPILRGSSSISLDT